MSITKDKNLSTTSIFRSTALILAAIGLNIALGHLVQFVFQWPVFIDSIGTILVGALLGPLAGAVTGVLSNIIWFFILGDQSILPFAITAGFIGWASGYVVSLGGFKNLGRVILSGLIVGIGAAIISAPISAYLFGGVTGSGTDYLINYLRETGANVLQAATLQGFISDPIDKVISFSIAWILWQFSKDYFQTTRNQKSEPFAALKGYNLAVLASLVSLFLSFVFLPAFSRSIFSIFYLAVLLSALRGGIRPALLTTAIGVLTNVLFLFSSFHEITITAEDFLRIGIFIIISIGIAVIADQLEKSNQSLQKSLQMERESQARIRAITDSVNEALLFISKDQCVLDLNQRFEEMFGVPPTNLINQRLVDIQTLFDQIFPESDEIYPLILSSSTDSNQDEIKIVKQNWPQERELQLYSTPIRDEGGFMGRLFVFRDVTHEREVDRMKTEFVSLVSHELRTPLTSIKGYTEMVLDGDAGEINEEVEEFLGVVLNNSERLVGLVNELLDISRIESGRIKLNIEPVNLDDIVQTVTATMKQSISDKRQTLEVDIDAAVTEVIGDKDKLVQVLTNYVSNAYKYTGSGGNIRININKENNHANVSVHDNGHGISPEDQARLFTRFYRVDNAMTREVGGTGLGLSIVKQLINLMGGDVGVESELGKGSRFWFTVPLSTETQALELAPIADTPPGEVKPVQGNILIVEDDPDISKLIEHQLKNAGYVVSTAHSAEEALIQIARDIPDLITLDIALPGMQGGEFIEKLHADPVSQDIPVVILSVYADNLSKKQFGSYRLPKPIHKDELLNTVDHLLRESHKKTLMIIDDDAEVCRLLRTELEQKGFQVKTAVNGQQGLSLARKSPPSVILLDMHLPQMDSLSILQTLKETPQTADVPVIGMIGSSDLKINAQARMLALGASDVIIKPLDLEQLIQEIQLFYQQSGG